MAIVFRKPSPASKIGSIFSWHVFVSVLIIHSISETSSSYTFLAAETNLLIAKGVSIMGAIMPAAPKIRHWSMSRTASHPPILIKISISARNTISFSLTSSSVREPSASNSAFTARTPYSFFNSFRISSILFSVLFILYTPFQLLQIFSIYQFESVFQINPTAPTKLINVCRIHHAAHHAIRFCCITNNISLKSHNFFN